MSVDDFSDPGNAPTALASPLAGGELWWKTLAASDEEFARLSGWLSLAEHSRAARFGREYLRRRYIIGRASLRWVLGRTLGMAPAAVPIVRGERGRPKLDRIDGIDFNISHTEDVSLIGVAREGRIGVDVERVDREVNADGLARKFLTSSEQATLAGLSADERRVRFLRYWTCKEAMSKATGDGIAAPFRRIEVDLSAQAPPRLALGPPPYVPDGWRLLAVDPRSGFLAALALWTSGSAAAAAC